ncbi:hypothetical protein GCM10011391_21800 [Pullulanibacillus camelliae]|uniref:SPOR domain-containing protein n=1 Tax=Pullulanibacillus camelliae TaxID=1707096 RepID=A0A8J2YHD6_9BACL|nr:hypothetical protein [Pullulanibacillus camelliae]GGE42645.1 hypothetical protein GCM10011391_21800 [Pullulanibacillus camelliae]
MTRSKPNEQQHRDTDDIIVSFNGKEHRLQEWTRKQVAAAEEDHSLDWKKTFQDQKRIDEPDYSEPASTVLTSKHRKKKKKKKRLPVSGQKKSRSTTFTTFFKHIWMPFITAIIVGLGIGFTVLILFSHNSKAPTDTETSSHQSQTATNTSSEEKNNQNAKALALTLTEIQGGVFTTQKAAEAGMNDLKQHSGLPAAVIKDGERYAVFIGIVSSDSAKAQLTNTFTSKGVDIYSKSWSYSVQSVHATDRVYRDLQEGQKAFSACLDASSQFLAGGEPSQAALNKAKKALTDFQLPKASQAESSQISQLKTLHDKLMTAFNQIKSGETGQQSLLDALNVYQGILQGLAK